MTITIPFLVLLILLFMPYIIKGFYIPQIVKQKGAYDNNHPRAQMSDCTGVAARLVSAQSNAWEALMFYMACLFIATQGQVSLSWLTPLSLVFLGARIFHAITYAQDWAKLRSLSFFVAAIAGLIMVGLAF